MGQAYYHPDMISTNIGVCFEAQIGHYGYHSGPHGGLLVGPQCAYAVRKDQW